MPAAFANAYLHLRVQKSFAKRKNHARMLQAPAEAFVMPSAFVNAKRIRDCKNAIANARMHFK
jgi:hypothetical protein